MRLRLFAYMLVLSFTPLCSAGEVRVAVAANFRQAAAIIGEAFQRSSGHQLTISSASTGALYSQIVHGAPFDVLLAADSLSPEKLEDGGYGIAGSRFCYARGELVLAGGGQRIDALADPGLSLAIANPATAPYGLAAQEVLQRDDFAAAEGRKLVRAGNVVQAFQFLHSGAVDLALVARSLAPENAVTIPPEWYTPISQHALLLQPGKDNPAAKQFMTFIKSNAAQAVITSLGYGQCP